MSTVRMRIFFAEAHHRKSNVGALIGSLFPGIGSLVGWLVGRSIWRDHASEELAGFVEDLAKAVEKGQKLRAGNRIMRVIEGCKMCLRKSDSYSSDQITKIKNLMSATEALRTEGASIFDDWLDDSLGSGINMPNLVHGFPKMAKSAISNWTKAAKECMSALSGKDSDSDED